MKKIDGATIRNSYPALIIIIGIFLRVFLFPNVPPGLNQDEAASGYEAYSLLLTGKDQWGNPFPAHFPGWGAGQSVLYAYLSIPAIQLLGLTITASRSTSLIVGILTLPLLYQLAKIAFDRPTALLALLLTAILPWHVMMSRWGLDCNLLPFFLLLGCYLVQLAVQRQLTGWWIIITLIPWAVGLYAYGISLLITPFLILGVFLSYRHIIAEEKWKWIGAFFVFLIIAFPLFLYVLKDYFIKDDLGIETLLPFSIPLLPAQRFSQVNTGILDNIYVNLKFVFSGFDDGLIWNVFPPFLPLFLIPLPFLLIGLYLLVRQSGYKNIFCLWLIACIPLLCAAKINVNRGNAIFLPAIVISAFGCQQIYAAISPLLIKKIIRLSITVWIALSTLLFAGRYFFDYPTIVARDFRYQLGDALDMAVQVSGEQEPILVTDTIPLDYVNVLYLRQISPRLFQASVNYSVDERGLYDVHNFGRYYFDYPALKQNPALSKTFVYLLKPEEAAVCNEPASYQTEYWQVGRCPIDAIP